MESWDIDEPNAIFWFFSDHGDINLMTDIRHPDPPMYYSWAMLRDNTMERLNARASFISIRDFFTTFKNKFKYDLMNLKEGCVKWQKITKKDTDREIDNIRGAILSINQKLTKAREMIDEEVTI